VRSFHEALVATVPDAHPTVSTEARLHISTDPTSGLQRQSWVWDAKALSIELAEAIIHRYGELGTLTWRPSNVIDRFRSPELFGSWLAGLFDSDGNVTTRPLLRICGTNRPALDEVRVLAQAILGIHGTVCINNHYEVNGERRLCYAFQVSRIEDVTRFALRCGSRHGTRRRALEEVLGFKLRDPLVDRETPLPPVPKFLASAWSEHRPLTRTEITKLAQDNGVPVVRLAAIASAHHGFRSRSSWTENDDKILRRLSSEKQSSAAIAEKLQRSAASIESRASRLQLRRRTDLAAMCIDEALRVAAPRGGTWDEIAKYVSASGTTVTAEQCRSRARRLRVLKPNGKHITASDREEVLRLHALGLTVEQVASAMGIDYLRARHIHDQLRDRNIIDTASRAAVALVATRSRGQEPVSADEIGRMSALRAQGLNPTEIARHIGRPRSTVAYHIARLDSR
jgi:DNA-binding NarL/FixJ family response regulator